MTTGVTFSSEGHGESSIDFKGSFNNYVDKKGWVGGQ